MRDEDKTKEQLIEELAAMRLHADRRFDELNYDVTLLRTIIQETVSKISGNFLESLVINLASALRVRYALITEIADEQPKAIPSRVRTLAFWDGDALGENYEYALAGAPCEIVYLSGATVYYPDSLRQHFSNDIDLEKIDAQSYVASPLKDSSGNIIGHLGVINDKPMRDKMTSKWMVEMFAQRAAAELQRQRAEEALKLEKEKSDKLLLNVLPEAIASKLKQAQNPIAERFDEATVLFADIVGFTELSTQIGAVDIVNLLNEIFSAFDELAEKHGLEKIKTIGDAYMVVGGVPNSCPACAEAIAEMALDMRSTISQFKPTMGEPFQIRIGINSGSVVAGVIGIKKFIYDLWGDTVNTASRMESHGLPGAIQVSATTYDRLKHKYCFEDRGIIPVKGKGEMHTYLLTGRKVY